MALLAAADEDFVHVIDLHDFTGDAVFEAAARLADHLRDDDVARCPPVIIHELFFVLFRLGIGVRVVGGDDLRQLLVELEHGVAEDECVAVLQELLLHDPVLVDIGAGLGVGVEEDPLAAPPGDDRVEPGHGIVIEDDVAEFAPSDGSLKLSQSHTVSVRGVDDIPDGAGLPVASDEDAAAADKDESCQHREEPAADGRNEFQ